MEREPRKYHKSLLVPTKNAANTGMTEREIAEFIGINYSTLQVWKSDIPEFREALLAGKEGPNRRVVAALYQSAIGYTVEIRKGQVNKQGELVEWTETVFVKPEVAAQIFFLKNRDNENWNDRTAMPTVPSKTFRMPSLRALFARRPRVSLQQRQRTKSLKALWSANGRPRMSLLNKFKARWTCYWHGHMWTWLADRSLHDIYCRRCKTRW